MRNSSERLLIAETAIVYDYEYDQYDYETNLPPLVS